MANRKHGRATVGPGDVDIAALMLTPNTEGQKQDARLAVADYAGREDWPLEDTEEVLKALGLIDPGFSQQYWGKGSQRKRVQ